MAAPTPLRSTVLLELNRLQAAEPAGSPASQALTYAMQAVASLPFLGELTSEVIESLGDTRFNYAVAGVWPGTTSLRIYAYGSQVHHGDAESAAGLLAYVQRQSRNDGCEDEAATYRVVPVPVPADVLLAEEERARNAPPPKSRADLEADLMKAMRRIDGRG